MSDGENAKLRITPRREKTAGGAEPSSVEESGSTAEESGSAPPDEELQAKVEEVLAAVRPAIQADGGDVRLLDVRAGVVQVQLLGNCDGCVLADMTVKEGLERVLKDRVEGVKKVVTL